MWWSGRHVQVVHFRGLANMYVESHSESKIVAYINTPEFLVYLKSLDTLGTTTPNLPVAIINTLRAIYHGIRVDLGVISPNQIYNSPTRFNASIATLPDPGTDTFNVRPSRDAVGNVNLSNPIYTVHVPDILYLTPQFTLKPMAQAITAVFVSTFTMLSAIWSVFNFVASSIMKAKSKSGRDQHLMYLVFRCWFLLHGLLLVGRIGWCGGDALLVVADVFISCLIGSQWS